MLGSLMLFTPSDILTSDHRQCSLVIPDFYMVIVFVVQKFIVFRYSNNYEAARNSKEHS